MARRGSKESQAALNQLIDYLAELVVDEYMKELEEGAMTVLKIQRSLSSNVDKPPAMYYDEDRRITGTIPWDDDLAVWFVEGTELALKIYVEAEVQPDGVYIKKKVEPKDW